MRVHPGPADMKSSQLLERYADLAADADRAFRNAAERHPEAVRCGPGCADCCHAFFGLFLVEAVFIKERFDDLPRKKRRAALARGDRADRIYRKLASRALENGVSREVSGEFLARERIRCPLLDDRLECILYPHRPVTCRVYGIPTSIRGQRRVCGKSGFHKVKDFPAFDLDRVHRDLFLLSRELLERAGRRDLDRASLLISVSKAIRTPVGELISPPAP